MRGDDLASSVDTPISDAATSWSSGLNAPGVWVNEQEQFQGGRFRIGDSLLAPVLILRRRREDLYDQRRVGLVQTVRCGSVRPGIAGS